MQVEFENGALGVIHASRFMTGYGNVLKLDVFGTKGAIEINHGGEWTEIRMCNGEDVHAQAWRRVAVEPFPPSMRDSSMRWCRASMATRHFAAVRRCKRCLIYASVQRRGGGRE